mmetsp:Transcript_14304/g.49264  ORF Transcript_14304/g.49264 Transcript_14304/m.49264 type:complete len:238 (+) Transcript_14304:298-1011(+)
MTCITECCTFVMRTICSRNSRVSARKALICRFVSTCSNCSTSSKAPTSVWIFRPIIVACASSSSNRAISPARAPNHFIKFSSRATRARAFSPVKYSLSSVMRSMTCCLQKAHFAGLLSSRLWNICLSLYSSCDAFNNNVMSASASPGLPALAAIFERQPSWAQRRWSRRQRSAAFDRRAQSKSARMWSNRCCSVSWPSVRKPSSSLIWRCTSASLDATKRPTAPSVSTFRKAAAAAP